MPNVPYFDVPGAIGRPRKPNRYGNRAQRTVYNGVAYDSKAEAEWAAELDFRVLSGQLDVHAWIRQVIIPLGQDFKTRVDFLVFGAPGRCHAEEVKGKETDKFKKTVRRLWPKYGPCDLHVLKKQGTTWHREVIPGKQGGPDD